MSERNGMTAGPWRVGQVIEEAYHDETGAIRILSARDETVALVVVDGAETPGQQAANARAIAALPELVALAQAIVGSAVDCGTYWKVDASDVEAARVALAKLAPEDGVRAGGEQ